MHYNYADILDYRIETVLVQLISSPLLFPTLSVAFHCHRVTLHAQPLGTLHSDGNQQSFVLVVEDISEWEVPHK